MCFLSVCVCVMDGCFQLHANAKKDAPETGESPRGRAGSLSSHNPSDDMFFFLRALSLHARPTPHHSTRAPLLSHPFSFILYPQHASLFI